MFELPDLPADSDEEFASTREDQSAPNCSGNVTIFVFRIVTIFVFRINSSFNN
jgi:hypothetical protein